MNGKTLEDLAYYLNSQGNIVFENFVLIDHGGGGVNIQFGDTIISNDNFDQYKGYFEMIGQHLTPGSFVHFQHCEAGKNIELIAKIAKAMNASILVSDKLYFPSFNKNVLGDLGNHYQLVHPDGTVTDKAEDYKKDLRDDKSPLNKGDIQDIID